MRHLIPATSATLCSIRPATANVTLQAGTDLNLLGSAVAADGDIALNAGNNVTVEAAENTASHYDKKSTKKSGVFGGGSLGITIGSQSSKSERKGVEVTESDSRSVIGTTGGNVVINAGKQVTLSATDVVAGRMKGDTDRKTGHIDITGSDIAIVPGRDQITQDAKQSSKSSGLTVSVADPLINGIRNIRDIAHSDSDSITKVKQLSNEIAATGADMAMGSSLPMTYGKSSSNSESHYEGLFNTGSALNAAGNVQLTATGKNGQGDILIRGSQVSAGEAVIMDAKRDIAIVTSTDPRLTGIYAAQAGLDAATQTMQGDMNPAAFKVSVSATAGKTSQTQDYSHSQQQGSTLHAGNAVIIKAREDIAGKGVDISGKTVTLNAGRDIVLSSSRDTETLKNSASGNSVSAGVGFSMGGSQNGFTGEFGYSQNQSRADGKSQTNQNSKVHADNILNIISGRDTTLNGAELSADKVIADVGRDLTIASVQDTSRYDSKSTSSGVNLSVCIPPICYGAVVQGSGSMDSQKLHNNYDSVKDQSGIYAGKDGFDISVGNHTQLDGAVIASDATADKNHLDTGTLGWKNLHNQSDWSGKQAGFTVSAGIGFNNDTQSNEPTSQGQPSTSLASVSGSESGITHSAVANGTITIRDKANQKQDVANLSRDTANANHSVKDSFDADKVKDKLEIQTAATSLGIQAANAYKAAMEEQAASQNATLKEELHQQNPQATEAELNAAVKNDSRYINADKEYGPGSDFWRATSGATGLIAGILGGNIQGGVAAGAAPYMAKLVKDATGENEAARIALHGIVSAALAEVQGGNGLAAAAGGMASAALMGNTLAKAFYGKDVKDLDGEQRAFISNLATAVGAAAGGSVGGDTFSAASGANAARVEVENNALGPNSFGKGMADMGLSQQSLAASMIQNGATADELTEALIKNSQGQIPEGQDAVKGLLTAWGEFFGFRSVR